MSVQEKTLRAFMVAVRVIEEAPEQLKVHYVPRGPMKERGMGGAPGRVPEYIARVLADHEEISVAWEVPPPDQIKGELTEDAERRMGLRIEWLDSLTELVTLVKGWAEELEWSTKLVKKKVADSEIGEHKAPALLLQKDLVRIALEPISRSTPTGEAVVDLYLLPGYDDIASLYYYKEKWHLHYTQRGTPSVGNIREGRSMPLTKASLGKVLGEMMNNAG
jgi:hypothetical protein